MPDECPQLAGSFLVVEEDDCPVTRLQKLARR
jgi:hypothetical protein